MSQLSIEGTNQQRHIFLGNMQNIYVEEIVLNNCSVFFLMIDFDLFFLFYLPNFHRLTGGFTFLLGYYVRRSYLAMLGCSTQDFLTIPERKEWCWLFCYSWVLKNCCKWWISRFILFHCDSWNAVATQDEHVAILFVALLLASEKKGVRIELNR